MTDAASGADPFPPDRMDLDGQRRWFIDRLSGRLAKDCGLLAARSALRMFPLLHSVSLTNFDDNPLRNFSIPLLRCFVFTLPSSCSSDLEVGSFFSVGSKVISDALTMSGYVSVIDSTAGHAAVSAINAARTSSQAKFDIAAAADSLVDAVRAASYYPKDLPAAARISDSTIAASIAAFEEDLARLDGTAHARRSLASDPLWLQAEGAPGIMIDFWDIYDGKFRAQKHDWDVWGEFYGGGQFKGLPFQGVFFGARNGQYLFGLPTARALQLWHEVAIIDDELWGDDPAILNAEFKRLVQVARSEVEVSRVIVPQLTAPMQKPSKTPIGKAVIEKQGNLLLMIELALPAIQSEIEAQERERPNSEEAIAKRDQIVAILRSMQEKHLALKNAVIDFPAGNISESKLVEVESEFWKPFRSFWSEKGSGLIENLTSMSLFLGGVGIATAIGAHPLASTVTIGVITGGKPVVEGLKAVFAPKSDG